MIGTFGSEKGARSITQVTMSVWFTTKDKVLSGRPEGGELWPSNGDSTKGSSRAALALADPLMYIHDIAGSSITSVVELLLA